MLYNGEQGEAETLRTIGQAIDAMPPDDELPPSVSADISNLRSLTRRNWLEISQIQYVLFSESEAFDQALDLLIRALDTDLEWEKTLSQLRQAAQGWDETGDGSYLWSEARMKLVRDEVERRSQELSEIERIFLKSEQERLADELLTNINHSRRNEIGLRLHSIGDTRPGVGLDQNGLPDIVWLPAYGTKSYEMKNDSGNIVGTFHIPGFHIAKYPVYVFKIFGTKAGQS